jgi:ketosteroid isomerase-like protein
MLKKLTFSTTISFYLLLTSVNAEVASNYEIIKEIIWNKEINIYKSRAKTGLDYYIKNTSPQYIGWPPGPDKPMGFNNLKQNQNKITFPNKEVIKIYFDDLALEGDTAIIYYHTHRTVLPNGKLVNQKYHISHVWNKNKNNEWKLLGAMGRLEN